MTARTVEVQLPADVAWSRLKRAARTIGKVEEVSDVARYLVMKARYGLSPVRLRVAVRTGSPAVSLLEIQARGQDVWGGASRKVIDRLCAAI